MASGFFNLAAKKVVDRTLDLTGTIKLMLVNSTYTYNPDDDFVSSGGSTPGAAEITAMGYTRGFGGAGRKTATLTFVEDDGNNRAIIKIADLTWTAIGGATNDTIVGAILVKEVTNDADSLLIAYFALTSTLTTGADVQLAFDATNGNIRYNC